MEGRSIMRPLFLLALPLAVQTAAQEANPYGVCAHLHGVADPAERALECRLIAATGIGRVRFDMEWSQLQKEPGGPFDFSRIDAVVADAEGCGLTVLPILFRPPKWASPAWEHLDEWGRYVEAVVSHYGDHFPEVEIWNEENLRHFWGEEPDGAKYAQILRVAYDAAKRANPRVRVLFGGTSGVPIDYIRSVYEAGGGPFFDAMNIHPYNHPYAPEGNLDTRIDALRELMAEFGDANKPIVITEHGWPTHTFAGDLVSVLCAGLKVARPGQKTWRTVYAATSADKDGKPPRRPAEAIEAALPSGSSVASCFGARLRERLAAGDVDLVVYPFDETFPADTFDDVRAFVEGGGVLAALGGVPMYYGVRETAPGVFRKDVQDSSGVFPGQFRVRAVAHWQDSRIPQSASALPSDAAVAAGFKGDPAGMRAERFQTAELLREGDEFIPLLAARDKKGGEIAAASVTRLAGGTNGCVICCGAFAGRGSAGEDGQARFLPRAMAMAFAMGIDEYFWYEFRSPEEDPQYSEHHFGLTHRNFTPNPAWGAYRNFTLARPAGSVQASGPWRDDAHDFHFPQWTRPDGVKAGMLWKTGEPERRKLRFDGDPIRFRDYTGRTVKPVRTAPGEYVVPLSGEPIYFEGCTLMPQ